MKDIFSNIEQQIESIDAKIEGIVKNAMDSKSYDKLNQKINNMVDSSTNAFGKGYERAEKVVKTQSEKFKTSFELQQEKLKEHAEAFKTTSNERIKKPSRKDLLTRKDAAYAGGMAMAIVGFILAGISGIAVLTMGFIGSFLPSGLWITDFWPTLNRIIFVPGFLILLLIAIIGILMMSRVSRFKKYIQVLGGNLQANVSEFSTAVNKSTSFVRRDLRKMISDNWFKQGYLVDETLIICKAAYEEYKVDQQRILEENQRLDQIRQRHERLPEEARTVIRRGEDFIKAIHENKVAISEYDMTIKLSHLELVLKKIFKRVEKHPEVVPQMRRMMDYYLPTTVKLLEAYVQLDKQAVQGINIVSAKAEIEESLDTLVHAYEKLLDDLFEDIMLDVSTDIAVLNTMLAQDGLTDDEFRQMNKRGEA